jgi:hypothetical protein
MGSKVWLGSCAVGCGHALCALRPSPLPLLRGLQTGYSLFWRSRSHGTGSNLKSSRLAVLFAWSLLKLFLCVSVCVCVCMCVWVWCCLGGCMCVCALVVYNLWYARAPKSFGLVCVCVCCIITAGVYVNASTWRCTHAQVGRCLGVLGILCCCMVVHGASGRETR